MTKLNINDMILDLLKSTNLSNQEIADSILEKVPTAKTTAKSVASVASVARRFGVDVPKRPSANPSERIAELEQMLQSANDEIEYLKAQLEEALERKAS